MNAKMETVTTGDHEMEDPLATGIAHATPIEAFRTLQQCLAKAEICTYDQHWEAPKAKIYGS